MGRYLWCEDSKSGFQFWRALFHELSPEITVESKGSNTGLRRAVSKTASDGNQYYILMDTSVDNPDVLRESRRLAADAAGKDNVHILRLHSFEFALLSFELLEQWVFAEMDALKEKRKDLLRARTLLIRLILSGGETSELAEFKKAFAGYDMKNTEQIAARLLYEITRNTGFETNKAQLGTCFICNCCEWADRRSDDICGLDADRLDSGEKARRLLVYSVLKEVFKGVEL